MNWAEAFALIIGSMVTLLAAGMPVFIAFLAVDLIGLFFIFNGTAGPQQLIVSIFSAVSTFTLVPLALFILMGEVLFHSGVAPVLISTVDKWLGRLPGRLSLLAVCAGTLLSTLTGASTASVAMLGSTLVPEMTRRGYRGQMTMGPIMASGGLAVMIPPSGLAVLLAVIAEISVGNMLIAIIIPGLLLASIYSIYIVVRCHFQPFLAPDYKVEIVSFSEKMRATIAYVLPIGIVIFLVIGVMFLGIATPSEAAATGVCGTMLLAAYHRRLTRYVLIKSFSATVQITVMILLIIAGATTFGQILALSGATRGLTEVVTKLPIAPILIVIAMQIVIMIMGMFMEVVSIMLIALPIFMPVIRSLGYDPLWFGVLVMMNAETAMISPPFGMSLFVMKSVSAPGTSMRDVYNAAFPFWGLIVIGMTLVMVFPQLTLWLPSVMK